MRALLSAQLGGHTHGIFQSRDPDKAAAVSIVASGLACCGQQSGRLALRPVPQCSPPGFGGGVKAVPGRLEQAAGTCEGSVHGH